MKSSPRSTAPEMSLQADFGGPRRRPIAQDISHPHPLRLLIRDIPVKTAPVHAKAMVNEWHCVISSGILGVLWNMQLAGKGDDESFSKIFRVTGRWSPDRSPDTLYGHKDIRYPSFFRTFTMIFRYSFLFS